MNPAQASTHFCMQAWNQCQFFFILIDIWIKLEEKFGANLCISSPQSSYYVTAKCGRSRQLFKCCWDRTKPSFQCQTSPLDVILAKVFTLLAQYGRTETLWLGFTDGGKRTMIHDESMNTAIQSCSISLMDGGELQTHVSSCTDGSEQ